MLLEQLHEQHAGIDIEKILDFELSLYDSQKPVVTGIDGQFLSGARLDNLVSCFIGLRAMLDTDHSKPSLLVCYDHEEIGSGSFHGAQGPFLRSVLERLLSSAEEFTRMIDRSVMISCDNAHGVHPNYAQKHDDNHRPLLNHGPVLKFNANQRYSTNSETAALFRQLCENVDVPLQEFVMRADMACGSTIGPITATGIGVKTVDVGVPQWAMHSIRETCGAKDPYYMYQVLKEFYVNDL
jgi:aspartyl aminopeptidase